VTKHTVRQAAQDAYIESVERLNDVAARLQHFDTYDNEWATGAPCASEYRAGHRCRRCLALLTDMEMIEAGLFEDGLFLNLCPVCLASVRQTIREETK
jgi:hypothetical protein